ncbi:MAG: ferredoxin--NADP reductase [Halieaceae bacterium]|jgi:ferredoxin--NADP+ reductase|nr:ferredoxin--NADP reductase [Halieaceae bacterium]
MAAFSPAKVTEVRHWNDRLFSFRTERAPEFRFENGHFTMVGLDLGGRPAMRAYSIASPNYDDHLEFLSIKVADGELTSRLQHIKAGDEVLLGRKPVGSLVLTDLRPGRTLYLFATGTGLAPFMAIIRDPEAYAKFERVVLVHGVRRVSDLAYRDYLARGIYDDEFLGEELREKYLYYPTVTREAFANQGRITTLLEEGRIEAALDLPTIDASLDRAMICGSISMLEDISALLDERGFALSPSQGVQGDYVIERAFAG